MVSERQTLLKKYDIPIDHLDFAYIKDCYKIKELEKIVKILRSREEGCYPELQKAAEDKLEELDPTNRLLRVEGQPLRKDNLDPNYWKQIFDDIEKWSEECNEKEKEREGWSGKERGGGGGIVTTNNSCLPPVRRPPSNSASTAKTQTKPQDKEVEPQKIERISAFDYDKWDKFDADAECLKMDLEEEKREQELPKKRTSLGEQDDTERIQLILDKAVEATACLSKNEKESLAAKERELGNELYKNKDYRTATVCYTKSIGVFPTPQAYNNRAASFLNLENYEMAVSDTTTVLQLEPDNVKALYRRAQAYEKISEFSKALSDLNSILKLEPDNRPASQMKEKLKNKKSSAKPKSSAASKAKRSKLALESADGKDEASSPVPASGGGEPVAGPSGVTVAKTSPIIEEVKDDAHQPVIPKKISSQHSKHPSGKKESGRDKKSERGSRKVEVIEMASNDDQPLMVMDWRRYWLEGRSAKIEVANKFREKSRKEPRQNSHVSKQAAAVNGGGDAGEAVVNPTKTAVRPRLINTDPGNFTQSWEQLTREKASLSDKATLLRSVRPHLLQTVIGNKLEEGMLCDFVLCLRGEFKMKTEKSLIVEYLTSFAHLDRFTIIVAFLPSNVKQVINELMDQIEADDSLRKLYK